MYIHNLYIAPGFLDGKTSTCSGSCVLMVEPPIYISILKYLIGRDGLPDPKVHFLILEGAINSVNGEI